MAREDSKIQVYLPYRQRVIELPSELEIAERGNFEAAELDAIFHLGRNCEPITWGGSYLWHLFRRNPVLGIRAWSAWRTGRRVTSQIGPPISG